MNDLPSVQAVDELVAETIEWARHEATRYRRERLTRLVAVLSALNAQRKEEGQE